MSLKKLTIKIFFILLQKQNQNINYKTKRLKTWHAI